MRPVRPIMPSSARSLTCLRAGGGSQRRAAWAGDEGLPRISPPRGPSAQTRMRSAHEKKAAGRNAAGECCVLLSLWLCFRSDSSAGCREREWLSIGSALLSATALRPPLVTTGGSDRLLRLVAVRVGCSASLLGCGCGCASLATATLQPLLQQCSDTAVHRDEPTGTTHSLRLARDQTSQWTVDCSWAAAAERRLRLRCLRLPPLPPNDRCAALRCERTHSHTIQGMGLDQWQRCDADGAGIAATRTATAPLAGAAASAPPVQVAQRLRPGRVLVLRSSRTPPARPSLACRALLLHLLLLLLLLPLAPTGDAQPCSPLTAHSPQRRSADSERGETLDNASAPPSSLPPLRPCLSACACLMCAVPRRGVNLRRLLDARPAGGGR